jgi:hypothetical protein
LAIAPSILAAPIYRTMPMILLANARKNRQFKIKLLWQCPWRHASGHLQKYTHRLWNPARLKVTSNTNQASLGRIWAQRLTRDNTTITI